MFITPSTFSDFPFLAHPPRLLISLLKCNEDFSHDHFELQNFILAQKMMFITPSTFSDFPFLAPPPCLFQPPRLLER